MTCECHSGERTRELEFPRLALSGCLILSSECDEALSVHRCLGKHPIHRREAQQSAQKRLQRATLLNVLLVKLFDRIWLKAPVFHL